VNITRGEISQGMCSEEYLTQQHPETIMLRVVLIGKDVVSYPARTRCRCKGQNRKVSGLQPSSEILNY
jgi:hypothetical protein